jgi:hypothetical protein
MAAKPSVFLSGSAKTTSYAAVPLEVTAGDAKLAMTDGISDQFEGGSAHTYKKTYNGLAWAYTILGIIQLGLGVAAFGTVFGVPKPVNAHIYTWLFTGGFLTTDWNYGAAVGIAIAFAGLIEAGFGIAELAPSCKRMISQAIDEKGVNGMRITLDILNDIPVWWFFLQTVHMHDALELCGYVLARILMDVMLYSAEMQNNRVVLFRNGKAGKGAPPSYYMELTAVALAGLFYWLLNGTYYVDSLIGTVQFVPTFPIYSGLIGFLGVWFAITEWYRPLDLMIRFSRMNVASCFQDKTTTYIVHAILTFTRSIFVSITIFIAAYYASSTGGYPLVV